jgi:4-deoxy-L-threo-5-hexosulose-uronate ketol-isomerase
MLSAATQKKRFAMEIRYAVGRNEFERMTTKELRDAFLISSLFQPGKMTLTYWETDRAVVGSAVPLGSALVLEAGKELASEYFCERREIGVLNIGAKGKVTVDGVEHRLDSRECLYIGRGSKDVAFASDDPSDPAKFYFISYPAHTAYPTTVVSRASVNEIHLGSVEDANKRTIRQCIHEKGVKSCQLVMGFTQLEPGSVWNTMPAHTHARRSEVYLYFGIPDGSAVFHLMGPSDETRNIVVHNGDVVLSPIWSIHAGCGTRAYTFSWAMGGENQRFDDMDVVAVSDLR